MSVERTFEGAYAISDIRKGWGYVHMLYYGYTRRDAIALFRAKFPLPR